MPGFGEGGGAVPGQNRTHHSLCSSLRLYGRTQKRKYKNVLCGKINKDLHFRSHIVCGYWDFAPWPPENP